GGAAGAARGAGGVRCRVVVADRVAEGGLQLLAATPDIEVASFAGKPREELERALAGADALIVRSETRVTADLLTRAPRLRVIARAGTGVDNIDVPAATRRGIAVMNAPGANTVSAAEHAMGLLLALVRHIPWAAEAMRRGEWDRKRFEGTELRGKTLGVVGRGRARRRGAREADPRRGDRRVRRGAAAGGLAVATARPCDPHAPPRGIDRRSAGARELGGVHRRARGTAHRGLVVRAQCPRPLGRPAATPRAAA